MKFYWGRGKWVWGKMQFCLGHSGRIGEGGERVKREHGVEGYIRGMYGVSIGTKIFIGIITISHHTRYQSNK